MPEQRSRSDRDWRSLIERHLASHGVAPTRRVEIIDEIAQHLQDRLDELKASGASDAEARRLALADLESPRLVRELARIERGPVHDPPLLGNTRSSFMENLWQDIRYALRSMRLSPAFSIVVIGTVALAIGANAAIFTVTDAAMLRPFPYPHMDRIVALAETTRAGQTMSISWPTFQDWQKQNEVFESIGVYRPAAVNLTTGGQPERLPGTVASSGVFGAMGIQPLAGRPLSPEDDRPGAARVTLISERLWRTRFNADPAILGRSIVLNGDAHAVVGVMPAGMRFPSRLTDVWLPLGPVIPSFPPRGAHPGLYGIGKLKPEVTFDRAVSDMDTIARRLEALYPTSNKDVAVDMIPYYEQIVENIRPTLLVLFGAVAFVLLIGCANLASLMLARGERRQHEIAMRMALGAERRRIVQQLLTESVVMSLIGGGLGIVLAWWVVGLFVASRPTTVPRIDLVAVNSRVLLFSVGLSMITGVVFGLVPALRGASGDLVGALKTTGRGSLLAPSRRFRSALVVGEIALALVLLVGAGLMIRSFAKLTAVDPGFDPDNVVTMRVTLPASQYADQAHWLAFHDELVRRMASIPGVTAVGLNSALPLEGGGAEAPVIAEGQSLPEPGKPGTMCLFQASSPDYLRVMGIPLVKGRLFTSNDAGGTTSVVIVDETLVRRVFGSEEPLGKRIAFEFAGDHDHSAPIWREIVGVVRHVHHYGLASEPPFVQVYVPLRQLPLWFQQRRPSMAVAARTSLPAESITASVRREVSAIDRDIPVYGVQTMKQYVDQNTEQPRLSVMLLVGFGGLALLLALMGIYGVVAYSVAERTQEIGVRMALGATRRSVLQLVLGQAIALIGTGVALGVAASLALSSIMRTLLYQVSERDPSTFIGIAVTLATVGVLASALPARRATRVDPVEALRM